MVHAQGWPWGSLPLSSYARAWGLWDALLPGLTFRGGLGRAWPRPVLHHLTLTRQTQEGHWSKERESLLEVRLVGLPGCVRATHASHQQMSEVLLPSRLCWHSQDLNPEPRSSGSQASALSQASRQPVNNFCAFVFSALKRG